MNSSGGEMPVALEETDLSWLGKRYVGKVRDSYVHDGLRFLIATDRLSAFDRILTTVPAKGQVLTSLATYWFERCASLVENHVVAVPDPCVIVAREVSIVPIEVVVRGYLAGSAWRDYARGATVSGVSLPQGMRQFEQLPEPIITPSTKEEVGKHDLPISESEIVQRGIVSGEVWEEIRTKALMLFQFASKELAQRGLLFADTKYEFGILDGRVVVADEIHTLDCSRFWVAESYEDQLRAGEAPEMLDKEPIRRWLLARNFSGEGAPPPIPDEYRHELMQHYLNSYERITGMPCEVDCGDPHQRIEANVRRYLAR